LGESVAVLGVGPVGQSVVALASLSGAGEIVAVDGVRDRLDFAKRMGATSVVSLSTPRKERLSQVRALTRGRGVDVVVEASGHPDAVSEALDLVRDGGRVVVCGHYTDNGSVEIHPHWQINRKHVELRGCWGSRFEHFHRAVALATRSGTSRPWQSLVSHQARLEDAGLALDRIGKRSGIKAIVRVAM
jgi:L-iditol 2-dehydrogenase